MLFYGEDKECRKLNIAVPSFSFGFDENSDDFVAVNVEEDDDMTTFDLYFKDNFIFHFNLPFIGRHLLIDALGVISLAVLHCFDPRNIEMALSHFKAPKRRFVVEEYHDTVFIDDYAHHPTEVKVTLEAAKKRYPDKKIIAIFKPHRASRVYYFVDDFAKALSLADEVYLLDFTSIDDKQDGVDIDISYLQERIKGSHILTENNEGDKELSKHKGEVLVFMSSKDIYNIAHEVKEYL